MRNDDVVALSRTGDEADGISPSVSGATECDLIQKSQAQIRGAQNQLLTICNYPDDVDAANHGSERAPRTRAILRKLTNGCRAMWAEADVRTTVNPAKLKGANPFRTDLDTLAGSPKKPRARNMGVGNYVPEAISASDTEGEAEIAGVRRCSPRIFNATIRARQFRKLTRLPRKVTIKARQIRSLARPPKQALRPAISL
ncbi:MAG: hypothetical protein WB816_14400 [Methylocystis sp.]